MSKASYFVLKIPNVFHKMNFTITQLYVDDDGGGWEISCGTIACIKYFYLKGFWHGRKIRNFLKKKIKV
jgi:hypothetical protein